MRRGCPIGHRGSRRPKFQIDTLEKALNVIEAMRMRQPAERVDYIVNLYPELLKCTHEHIAEILGLSRESVTRGMKE